MSINEVMKIGTNGMSKAQKAAEQERRLKVVERINAIGNKLALSKADGDKAKVRKYNRDLNLIKSQEGVWLKSAGWFMYC